MGTLFYAAGVFTDESYLYMSMECLRMDLSSVYRWNVYGWISLVYVDGMFTDESHQFMSIEFLRMDL